MRKGFRDSAEVKNYESGQEGDLMYSYICEKCKGYVDPGELVGNICKDCHDEILEKQKKDDLMLSMMNSNSEQMVIDFLL